MAALTVGCGSSFEALPPGVYTGVVSLLPGATPGCASVTDNSVSCCDDTQTVSLSVQSLSDGYYVDGWAAVLDRTGGLSWQETAVASDPYDATCTDSASTDETLSSNFVYTFALVNTQTCPTGVQSFQCNYTGQLYLQ